MFNFKRLFLLDINETKRLIRSRIEEEAEECFENERIDGYATGAIDFGEDISLLLPHQKEELRVRSLADLKSIRNSICYLWEKMICRTAGFQVWVDFTTKLTFVASIVCVFLKIYQLALIFVLISLILYLFTKSNTVFSKVMFIVCGSCFVSDRLLGLYNRYGRTEASIHFADYRNLSHIDDQRDIWVFTTSHKNPPG